MSVSTHTHTHTHTTKAEHLPSKVATELVCVY